MKKQLSNKNMNPVKVKLRTTRAKEQELSQLSPFELKDKFISLANDNAKKSTYQMLNAGRGNPNWIAATPREGFFLLGLFAVGEARLANSSLMNTKDGMAGMPAQKGIYNRFKVFIKKNLNQKKVLPGAKFLQDAVNYGIKILNFNPDAWVYELTDAVIGDQYPTPDRMLTHIEKTVHKYLVQEMCNNIAPEKSSSGKYDLFAVEGGTAAMCYIYDTLMIQGLINRGDKIALMVPTFTPYIEMSHLDRYKFNVIEIHASEMGSKEQGHTWQFPDSEIDKLTDREIKLLFVVNPTNPPSVAIRESSIKRIEKIVRKMNPNLMIVTDDVYGTFVEGFRSLMSLLPHNTIGVYSFSKYFGCTGWRLGVIAVHEKNIYDSMLSAIPEKQRRKLHQRYAAITMHPEKLKFIDRLVADSRQVALNHTAGLSLPQQAQMALFSLFALTDKQNKYKKLTRSVIEKRRNLLWKGMNLPLPPADPNRAWYYVELDILNWAKSEFGKEFADYLVKHFEPVDMLFRLAELTSIVLLNGGGFGGPEWSVRVSLANLPDEAYEEIGKQLRNIAVGYIEDWKGKN